MSEKTIQDGRLVAGNNHTEEQESPDKVILDAVPESRKKDVKDALTIIREEMYSGPIPPPESLARYEEILPGSADRILKMAEKQQEHRMTLETKVVGSQTVQSKRGQVFGFIIVFLCVAVAIFFAVKLRMTTFAVSFLSVTMVVVVGLFLTGRNVMKKDLESKSRDQRKDK